MCVINDMMCYLLQTPMARALRGEANRPYPWVATQALTDQRETKARVVRAEVMATTVYQAHLDHQDLPHQ